MLSFADDDRLIFS